MNKQVMNTAVSLITSLGAYCPRVKLSNEEVLAVEKAKAKRRTRPMTGRGNYGLNLMAHFDMKRRKAEEAKQAAKA